METTNEAGGGRKLRRGFLYGLLGTGALATLFAARPIAAAVQGGGFRGFGHHGRWAQHGMSPEAFHEHAQVAVKWALKDVDATDEQQERVAAIAKGAIEDLHKLKDQHRQNRTDFAAQLAGAAVDRARLEEIRKAEMALADAASQRVVKALADVSEVLTPDQRQQLLAKAQRLHR
jgi:Spy/CpxP family protein refolding chaperone